MILTEKEEMEESLEGALSPVQGSEITLLNAAWVFNNYPITWMTAWLTGGIKWRAEEDGGICKCSKKSKRNILFCVFKWSLLLFGHKQCGLCAQNVLTK